MAFSSFVKTILISCAPNSWVGKWDEFTRFVLCQVEERMGNPEPHLPPLCLAALLNRIERDVVQSSDQQQWQLRQAHADHEQHRAEEQNQRGPNHDEPERGSANQRKHHHDEGFFYYLYSSSYEGE